MNTYSFPSSSSIHYKLIESCLENGNQYDQHSENLINDGHDRRHGMVCNEAGVRCGAGWYFVLIRLHADVFTDHIG